MTNPPEKLSPTPSDMRPALYPNAISPTPTKAENTEESPLTAWDIYEEKIVSTPPPRSKFASKVTSPLTNPRSPSPLTPTQLPQTTTPNLNDSNKTHSPVASMEFTISHHTQKLEGIETDISAHHRHIQRM